MAIWGVLAIWGVTDSNVDRAFEVKPKAATFLHITKKRRELRRALIRGR